MLCVCVCVVVWSFTHVAAQSDHKCKAGKSIKTSPPTDVVLILLKRGQIFKLLLKVFVVNGHLLFIRDVEASLCHTVGDSESVHQL